MLLVDGALDPGVDLSDCSDPDWLVALINSTSYDAPRAIYRYAWDNSIVFYTPAKYADGYSTLYDRCGTVVCHPDGGLTGRGDGKCPGFASSATGRTLIWSET